MIRSARCLAPPCASRCVRAARASPLASPRSDPTAGRAVFTGATVPTATSIELESGGDRPGLDATTRSTSRRRRRSISYGDRALDSLDLDTGALSPGATVARRRARARRRCSRTSGTSPATALTLGCELRSRPAESSSRTATRSRYTRSAAASARYARRRRRRASGSPTSSSSALSLRQRHDYLHLRYARDTALEAGHGPTAIDSDCGGRRAASRTRRRPSTTTSTSRAAARRRANLRRQPRRASCELVARTCRSASRITRRPASTIQNAARRHDDVHAARRATAARSLHGAATVLHLAAGERRRRAARAPARSSSICTSAVRWEDLSRVPGVRRARLRLDVLRSAGDPRVDRAAARLSRSVRAVGRRRAGRATGERAAVRRAPRLRDRRGRRRPDVAAHDRAVLVHRSTSACSCGSRRRSCCSRRTACSTSRACTSRDSAFDPRDAIDVHRQRLRLLDRGVRGGAQRLRASRPRDGDYQRGRARDPPRASL